MERCGALKNVPLAGRTRPEIGIDVRSLSVRPIVVFYRVREDRNAVEILRIIDGWRDRRTIFPEDV